MVGLAGACLLTVASLAAQTATQPTAQAFGNFWAYAGALATSAILGGVKKLDTSVTNSSLFRKLQPVITLAGSFGLAALAAHGGPSVDPSMLTTAPVATLAAITIAELLGMLQRSVRLPGG